MVFYLRSPTLSSRTGPTVIYRRDPTLSYCTLHLALHYLQVYDHHVPHTGHAPVRLELLDYFFYETNASFSLMPMLEPPFSATRYASFFLVMLVLLLVFVTSLLAAYACFRRFCSSPRFLPLGMPVFLVYARTYARFRLIFGCLCLFSSIMLAIWRDFDISSLLAVLCWV